MPEIGLMLFLIFIGVSLLVAARAALKSQKKQKVSKKRYRPYQPQQPQAAEGEVVYRPAAAPSTQIQSESRAAYASADEFFRAGMYDKAKEEYLKTGRIFGAAKSTAAKGREFIPDSLQTISRYAPEREEEMIRNLSRYFYDSGDIELSALILYESELIDEADAVLATVGKSVDDLSTTGVVEVTQIDPSISIEDSQKSLEELEVIAAEVKEEKGEVEQPPIDQRMKATQPLKVATTDLEERCSVCMSPIKAGESFVRCPFCEVPSHYSHIVEWIKVKPQCPNCRKKLISRMFQA